MDDRELRSRIKKLDPVSRGVATRSVMEEPSRHMLEKLMEQPVSGKDSAPSRWVQRYAAAAAVVAVALGAFTYFGGSAQPDAPPLQLSLGESNAISSCIPVSAEFLKDMPVAFEGTTTAVDGELVTLEVDEWFSGGDTPIVELVATTGLQALIGGIAFEVGTTYLVSAENGTVNYCGYSDLATPELRAIYDEAFPD
jgi:hypothetical protein